MSVDFLRFARKEFRDTLLRVIRSKHLTAREEEILADDVLMVVSNYVTARLELEMERKEGP